MAQRCASRVRFPDPVSCVGWVCCWFSSLLRGFFPGFSGFPPSSKINISEFQFDREFESHEFVSLRLLCATLVKKSPHYLLLLLPTYDTGPELNSGHIGGRRALSPLRHPCSLFVSQTQILCPGHKKCFLFCSETSCVRKKCFPACATHDGDHVVAV